MVCSKCGVSIKDTSCIFVSKGVCFCIKCSKENTIIKTDIKTIKKESD